MEYLTQLPPLTPLDLSGLLLLLVAWVGIGWRIEKVTAKHSSVSVLMAEYRREWMQHGISRDPRVFDAMIVASLREGTAFFASACMIAIGGAIALVGNIDTLSGLAAELAIEQTPVVIWEVKLILIILLLTNGFLKFVWSNRLFGYCCVMMGAVPNDPNDPLASHRGAQAGELNISAAKAFNRGLRSVYFTLGASAWLLGSIPLIIATILTVIVLWRREFASHSRSVLLQSLPPVPVTKA